MIELRKKNNILTKLLSTYSDKNLKENIIQGQSNIMFSCPHSVTHYRNGIKKCDEPHTLLVVDYLHKIYDIPYIYKIESDMEDANFDEKSNYKNILCDYIKKHDIKLLIDLHEMKRSRKEMINIGTNGFKNIKDLKIVNSFVRNFSYEKMGMISIDEPFSASGNARVSTHIHNKTKINCVQIELNSNLFFSDAYYNSILKTFKTCIKDIISIMEKSYEK